MEFEWDEAKRIVNLRKHGVDFARVIDFDWRQFRESEDRRTDYGERAGSHSAELVIGSMF